MTDAEELWQAYDLQGQPTDNGLTKAEARTGQLHGAAHIWMWRVGDNGLEILLQTRAKDKATWPGYLDISAAGHIDFGEEPISTALREAREEVGLEIAQSKLELLFVHHAFLTVSDSNIIENEFQWVYGYNLSEDVILSYDDEVQATRWLSLAELKKIVAGEDADTQIVPHGTAYFVELLQAFERMGGNHDYHGD